MTYGTESYMHRLAKEILAGWLRDSRQDDYHTIFGLSFRPNRYGVTRGVHLEYPFVRHKDGKTSLHFNRVWDEMRWYKDIYGNDGCCEDGIHDKDEFPPTYEECVKLGYKVEAIFDIALQHKGSIHSVIEVVHKNDVPDFKIDLCEKYSIPLYQVSAHRILSQVGVPEFNILERLA